MFAVREFQEPRRHLDDRLEQNTKHWLIYRRNDRYRESDVVEQLTWLLLSYKVPSEPSSKRVAIWRKIRGLGAVYLQNGVCVLPNTDAYQRQLKIIQNDILSIGGEAALLDTAGFDKQDADTIVAHFNAARNAEYEEFLEKCQAYVAEIHDEIAVQHFTYAELQENDEDLKKLRHWLNKITTVDFYGAPLRAQAEQEFAVCEQVLEVFTHHVFDAEVRPDGANPRD